MESYLFAIEVALLDVNSLAELPVIPADLPCALRDECSMLQRLLLPSRGGNFAAFLADPWLAPLHKFFIRENVEVALAKGGLSRVRAEFRSGCSAFVGSASCGSVITRKLAMMMMGIAALQLYARLNWSGPPEDDREKLLPFHPTRTLAEDNTFAEILEVDGEPAYELLLGAGYLWLATEFLGLNECQEGGETLDSTSGSQTASVWRGRCAFLWQLSLADASERGSGQSPFLFLHSVSNLMKEGEDGVCGVLVGHGLLERKAFKIVWAGLRNVVLMCKCKKKSLEHHETLTMFGMDENEEDDVPTEDGCAALGGVVAQAPATMRAVLLVELGIRICWYNQTASFPVLLQAACDIVGVTFELSAALGIRRTHQVKECSLLVVKVSTTEVTLVGETPKPKILTLHDVDDLTDVLEEAKLSENLSTEDRFAIKFTLGSVEQLLLLAECNYRWCKSNPDDESTLEEIRAFVERILSDDGGDSLRAGSWLGLCSACWYRCRSEHHRNKTQQRAAFQLQTLLEHWQDLEPSAELRLVTVHSAGYPARFHLQREVGRRMLAMGLASSAFEHFKVLRMWQDAIDCLLLAGRGSEAKELLHKLLESNATPQLWCCLGDVEGDPEHYRKAWVQSGHHCARAQRSLARHFLSKDKYAEVIDCLEMALDINPMYPSMWSILGVAHLRLEHWQLAVHAFARCVSFEEHNGEGWANLAMAHVKCKNAQSARMCINQAVRYCPERWMMWESFLSICLQLRDIQGSINAMRHLVQLQHVDSISESILGVLTWAIIRNDVGMYQTTKGAQIHLKPMLAFFEFLTSKCSGVSFHFRFYAALQHSVGMCKEALANRLREARAAQAHLWTVLHDDEFAMELEDLYECFLAIAEHLDDPQLGAESNEHKAPFAYSMKNICQQLRERLESALHEPAWKTTYQRIAVLGARAEEQVKKSTATSHTVQPPSQPTA